MLYPITSDVLACQESATLCDEVWVPAPDKVSLAGEFEALLSKTMLPAELPAVCGAKVTVNGTLCPAGTVAGNVMPLTEYPSPFHVDSGYSRPRRCQN